MIGRCRQRRFERACLAGTPFTAADSPLVSVLTCRWEFHLLYLLHVFLTVTARKTCFFLVSRRLRTLVRQVIVPPSQNGFVFVYIFVFVVVTVCHRQLWFPYPVVVCSGDPSWLWCRCIVISSEPCHTSRPVAEMISAAPMRLRCSRMRAMGRTRRGPLRTSLRRKAALSTSPSRRYTYTYILKIM